MTQPEVITFFYASYITAGIFVFLYSRWLNKNLNVSEGALPDNQSSAVENSLKYFKIVNR